MEEIAVHAPSDLRRRSEAIAPRPVRQGQRCASAVPEPSVASVCPGRGRVRVQSDGSRHCIGRSARVRRRWREMRWAGSIVPARQMWRRLA